MKTLIEIHALQNFAPSNLNRDDTGAPKDAFFGGTRRARISSQCQKRAVRMFFNEKIKNGIFKPEDVGFRSKRTIGKLVSILVEKGHDTKEALERAKLTLLACAGILIEADGEEGEEKSDYLVHFSLRELLSIANLIHSRWDEENWDSIKESVLRMKKDPKKMKKEASKKASKEIKNQFERIMNGGQALDVALFGRMLADMPEKNQNAACQVAHSISTHAVEREFDYFTAVDDLKPEDTAGADMIGTVEFNSACYYRYAVVDWMKLVENLQADEPLSAKGLRAFLEGFVVAEPTGKQNTFAAHNPPEFVSISVRHNTAPRSLANAFETPVNVKKELTAASAEKLVEKGKSLQSAYGGEGQTFVLSMTGTKLDGFGTQVSSLQELLDMTLAAVLQG